MAKYTLAKLKATADNSPEMYEALKTAVSFLPKESYAYEKAQRVLSAIDGEG